MQWSNVTHNIRITSAMKQGYTKYQCNEANKAKQYAGTKYSKYSPDKICVQSSRNGWREGKCQVWIKILNVAQVHFGMSNV